MVTPYRLEYFGTGTEPTDITGYVEQVNKFTDSGTGEITSSILTLDARFGDFITEDNEGETPIIKQYDVLRLTLTDDDGNIFSRYLIQDDLTPQKNIYNDHLTLELLGRERFLQKMFFPGSYSFFSFKDVILRIRDFYNTNRGAEQPRLIVSSHDLNMFPAHTYGVFDFGPETSVYDALMDVVNRLSVSTAGGGDGRFYGLTFDEGSRSVMLMRIRPQGNNKAPIVLEKPITLTEVKQPIIGNIMVVRGQPGTGSFPHEVALWRSLVEEFDNLPLWDSTITYRAGAYVRYEDAVYQTDTEHAEANLIPGVSSLWRAVKFIDYIVANTGDAGFQYSPWTEDKSALWKNRGGNPGSHLINAVPQGGSAYDSVCVGDSNWVIRDRPDWRDWVDCRVATLADIPDEYLYAATDGNTDIQSRTYHGMRVLVDPRKGTIEAPFVGHDKFGKQYENSLVMQDRDGDWIVFQTGENNYECVVRNEGRVYQFSGPLGTTPNGRASKAGRVGTPVQWRDVSSAGMGNDCFHYPSVFENVSGLIGSNPNSVVTLENGPGTEFTDRSAIQIDYTFSPLGGIGDLLGGLLGPVATAFRIIGLFTDSGAQKPVSANGESQLYAIDSYNIGWWATLWEAPDPLTTHNGIGENVGQLFGGTADDKRPILDLQNLNQTPSGQTGYGHTDSNSLGQLDGFKVLVNFRILGLNTDTLINPIPFRAVIYDLLGNVWQSDVAYRFQGDTQEFSFPFSSFRIYRARTSVGNNLANAITRIITPELAITEIFNRRLVKRICLHTLVSHDDLGRYDPWSWEGLLRGFQTILTGTSITYSGTVDAFHFTKAPLAIARDTAHSTLGVDNYHLAAPIKKFPKISNVAQLQKIANAELDIIKSRADIWTAKYDGIANVCAEDSVYIKDKTFISESENGDNTRLLTVKKVTYSVGDSSSESGFITTLELFRRPAT